jgi:hypothetical protein
MGRPDEKSENSHQKKLVRCKNSEGPHKHRNLNKVKKCLRYLHSAPHLSQIPIVFLCPEILKYNKVSAMYIVGFRFTLCSEYIF